MEDKEKERDNLISSKSPKQISKLEDETGLWSLKNFLNWACVDQSNSYKTTLSFSVFFLLCIGVPILAHFILSCSNCDEDHRQPFDAIVELSLSSISALSYFSLVNFVKKYGLAKFLFLDKLFKESDKVREGYSIQLQKSIKLLYAIVIPCFVADTSYKIWWYITGGKQIPHWGNIIVSHTIACILEQFSWLYRTSIFLLACVLYRVSCYLHILRLQDFALAFFKGESDVKSILADHLRIRKNLRIISHRFRVFILSTLLLVTASQLASLLVTTKSHSHVDIYIAGELVLCSITLVTGVCVCLGSAAKITHKAQSVTALAAKWHICSIVDSFDETDGETPIIQSSSPHGFPFNANPESDEEEEGDGEDELDNTKMMPTSANTDTFQKRQALVTYLENNRAGITVFGFMLDRTYLNTIFGVISCALVA